MKSKLTTRLKHAWDAFKSRETEDYRREQVGMGYGTRPDRLRLTYGNERSIIAPIYNRIAMDVSSVPIQHVRLDQNGSYLEPIKSSLSDVLVLAANVDQTGRALIQDVVMSMFDEGCVAIIPVDTSLDPTKSGSYEIYSLRCAQILEWFPAHIRVRLYNEKTGLKEDITVPKKIACIIENPLYAIMNERNSTLKRLIRKLNLLDAIDEQSGSGKLDLLIQLPYILRTQARKDQADQRRTEIESQLTGSKYGIAYIDGTEKVTQLNRPAENNLLGQIEYLTRMLHSQLGLTESVFDGTADEKTMLNYQNRTIEPVLSAIIDEMKRKFLTKTARSQNQSIMFFRDVFKLTPVNILAEIADKFTRNEILSSNDVRAAIGYRPSKDPKADELRNKNLNQKEPDNNVKDLEKTKEDTVNEEI